LQTNRPKPWEHKLGAQAWDLWSLLNVLDDHAALIPYEAKTAEKPDPTTNLTKKPRLFPKPRTKAGPTSLNKPRARLVQSTTTITMEGGVRRKVEGDATEQDFLKKLMERIERLEMENRALRSVTGVRTQSLVLEPTAPAWKTLYRLDDGRVSLSEPWATFDSDRSRTTLNIKMPLADPGRWLEKQEQEGIAFVVFKDYSTTVTHKPGASDVHDNIMPAPVPEGESIRLISEPMIKAFKAYAKIHSELIAHFPDLDPTEEIHAPYRFWYHCRSNDPLRPLPPEHKELMELVTDWIEANYGEIYRNADERLSLGLVSEDLLDYLVRPGDVLVTKSEDRFVGYMASSWTKPTPMSPRANTGHDDVVSLSRSVDCWHWEYDGVFYRKHSSMQIELKLPKSMNEVQIHKLNVFPLRYTNASIQARLKADLGKRGNMQWSCRGQKLVEYLDESHDHSGIVRTISY
jgi:hypothetical protein